MSRSFFAGNDAQLYTGSLAFSTQISATPTVFGLTAGQATAYAALNATYAAKYLAATNPMTRTKGAVQAKDDAKSPLKISASNLAKIIDGTPTVTNEQKADLGLSVRGIPQPVTELGQPTKCKASLSATGAVELSWKCASPRATGMVYQIFRRIGGVGEFDYVGGSGEKKFTDNTLPMGSSQVTYQIQAVRSTAVGPWTQFNVNFGTAPGESAMVTEVKQPKLAA